MTTHGFTLAETRYSADILGNIEIYTHKSGATLICLKREDECKTFGISFKTLPTDDTGVFHILEHSVLCGSRKFPTKEPFTDLLRSSMNTFLNAMTYPDKTLYPVSSKNDRDFYNLVDVYMDAVLHPMAVGCEEIFRQEGWRYEAAEDGGIEYNGVVYSEMKGAYSSPDEIAERYLNTLLFPGGTYSRDSGGDPKHIPDLTYSDFCEAHRKYYKPENAYIILDGSVDPDEILPLLDGYLSEYEPTGELFEVEIGGEVITEPLELEYAIDENEEKRDKTRLTLGYLTSDISDSVRSNAFNILFDTIADTNASRLKKRILDTGLCTSVAVYPTAGLLRQTLTVEFKNVKDGCEEKIVSVFDEALREIIAEGITKEELAASIDLSEFRAREGDYGSYPKGIIYTFAVADYVNYGLHPYDALDFSGDYEKLRALLDTGYYVDLLGELLTMPRATLVMRPSYTVAREEGEAVLERLARELGSLNDAEREALTLKMERFTEWQSREDTPEALATIPRLSLADLGNPPKKIDTEKKQIDGATVLVHDLHTGGITYNELHFDISDCETSDIPLISLFTMLYSSLDTERSTADGYNMRTKSTLGDITVLPNTVKYGDEARLYITVKFSSLDSKRAAALDLIHELLYEKIFDNKDEVRRKLIQLAATSREALASSGHSYAVTRSAAKFDLTNTMKEYLSGYEFMRWIGANKDTGDDELDRLIARATELFERAFTKERLTASITTDRVSGYENELIAMIRGGGSPSGKSKIELLPCVSDGIAIPSKVSFAVLGTNLNLTDGQGRIGTYSILSNLLSYNLLWEEIRVKGGAYGTGFSTRYNSGTTFFYSYRDPNPKRTLDIFKSAAEVFSGMIPATEELTDTIIAAIGSSFGQVKTPQMEGSGATAQYMAGKSHNDIIEMWNSTVEVDRDALEAAVRHLGEITKSGVATVVGPREVLQTLGLDEILEL